jgi:hypothetical protein
MKNIALLGVEGCPTCARLDQHVAEAIKLANVEVCVEKVTEPEAIMEYSPGGLPAVYVDGVRKAVRRVPEVSELVSWIKGE